jgi:5'-3' exonuclease
MNTYLGDLKHHMPFKILKIRAAEADDIIAILAMQLPGPVTISSNDEDYLQLSSKRVKIWNPMKRKYVTCDDPRTFLTMKCLMGQSKDDILNVKTPKDWGQTAESFGKRKPGLGEVTAKKIIDAGLDNWLEENKVMHRFKRNRNLIDFRKIPATIQNRILTQYDSYNFPPPANMREFFKKFSMQTFLENYHIVERCLMRLY